ncbi:putative disease resistance protein At3g14460 isoform X3 [Prosopis cineraria]|uniref:putative disease resistance protein At3g14460 isoform X3 n=1 Tax=Prosopis cineraria TaxID=364024 RepID=UPI00240F084A|nr:putative disease resistance protein At3g14460 isoform X3 [Prosopis cineraria]
MAEALLSAVFNALLERLTPNQGDLINLICGKKLDYKLLQRLKPSLIAAIAVINDAELKQLTDPAVKDWLDELKDAAYDLEDLMDEISTRAAIQKKDLIQNGVGGCKILVTTRLERVALRAKTISSFYRLNVLSDEDCLSIFAAHAFHSRVSIVNSCLEGIRSDIASKCKGLPLAAKVLGKT